MLNTKKVIAIIPARGGSKRLPRKNILPLGGKPLIGWTIEAAQNSVYVDEIFISTDDQEIADIASQFGVAVPELRPDYLSTDTSTTQSVIFYTLEKYCKDADVVVLLQPTSPFRCCKDIDESLEMLSNKDANMVVSVTKCEHSPLWANTLTDDLSMKDFVPKEALKPAQELQSYYRLNGAIYAFDVESLVDKGEIIYDEHCFAYNMSQDKSIDIDTEFDFKLANFFIKEK
ncbi:acylneuraminate cytidylyltransferase family protein [Vibrio scophthalmi]|uniref:acylneuraminate cytidylyltransferase family protein n=1 Tax=Vibrio scophthalmi TaxID=45658 RepID=UPI003AAA58F7